MAHGVHKDWFVNSPSLKLSADGRPPGPVWRYAIHFYQPGPDVVARLGSTFDRTRRQTVFQGILMPSQSPAALVDGARCKVVGGTHAGKSGTVRDINTSKTGQITVTVVQQDGVRFKTLAKNVVVSGQG